MESKGASSIFHFSRHGYSKPRNVILSPLFVLTPPFFTPTFSTLQDFLHILLGSIKTTLISQTCLFFLCILNWVTLFLAFQAFYCTTLVNSCHTTLTHMCISCQFSFFMIIKLVTLWFCYTVKLDNVYV